MKKFLAILLGTMLVLSLAACGQKEGERLDKEAFVLDTIVSFSVWTNNSLNKKNAEDILNKTEALCKYYEDMMSKSIETSDIYRINHSNGAPVVVSPQTAYMLEEGIKYSELSGGYFDITILPIKDLWDFKAEHPVVPTESQIQEALSHVDYHNIVLGDQAPYVDQNGKEEMGRSVTLKNGAMVDLGGIAKGYIADQVSEYMKEAGVTKGIINLGGNVLMIGEKEPGAPWRVGIQNPDGEQNSYVGAVSINDESVVTSGVYERFFEVDGKVYHHLLDPFTGKPADNGLQSVTILSDKSVDGDALSTSCFVLGLEKGMALAESLPHIEAVFITWDGEIHQTSGVSGYAFEITNN